MYGNQVAHLQEGPELEAFWTAGFKVYPTLFFSETYH